MSTEVIITVEQLLEIDINIGPINNIEVSLVDNFASADAPADVSIVNFAKAESEVSLVSLVYAKPVNPLCVPLKNGTVFLQWEKPNENVIQYEVFISLYGELKDDSYILLESSVNESVIISELPVSVSLYFRVRAKYIDNAYSDFAQVKLGKILYAQHPFRVVGMPGTQIEKDAIIGFTHKETGFTVKAKSSYGLTL